MLLMSRPLMTLLPRAEELRVGVLKPAARSSREEMRERGEVWEAGFLELAKWALRPCEVFGEALVKSRA